MRQRKSVAASVTAGTEGYLSAQAKVVSGVEAGVATAPLFSAQHGALGGRPHVHVNVDRARQLLAPGHAAAGSGSETGASAVDPAQPTGERGAAASGDGGDVRARN
jgi:hypothetical protein